jgi:hypothetical protein
MNPQENFKSMVQQTSGFPFTMLAILSNVRWKSKDFSFPVAIKQKANPTKTVNLWCNTTASELAKDRE